MTSMIWLGLVWLAAFAILVEEVGLAPLVDADIG